MQRLKQAKARQRKASLSPVHMQTRSKRGDVSVSPERKENKRDTPSHSPHKPAARYNTKQMCY